MDREKFLPDITEEDRKLIKLFKEEVSRINLLYLKAVYSKDVTKANQLLRQIKKISNYLSNEYGKWADVRIPQEYVKGSSYIDDVLENDSIMLENLGKEAINSYMKELGQIHIEAVNALLDNSKNYVKSSLDGMERQAISMVNELQQQQIREQLAKGIISGEGKMNDRLIKYFTDNGISGFKDRGGKYWSMDRYVDMLVRTETSIANTQGTINRALELGITQFKIVEHIDCCKECAEMNGDVVDIRDGVVELPPFHPNCRGYIIAVLEDGEEVDVGEEEDIQNKKALTPEERREKAFDIIENSTMYLKYEQGALVDMNGNVIRMAVGNSNSVHIRRLDIKQPFTLTHNHPNSSCFSSADLKNWYGNDYQYEVRASSKVGTYSLYAERQVDKLLFMRKYKQLDRSASIRAKADMRTVATQWRNGGASDYIKLKDGTYIYAKDNPLEFDRLFDEHIWKYHREAVRQAAEYVPGVEFKYIESDGKVKDNQLNNMYLDKVKELYKTKRDKDMADEDEIEINKYL